MLYPSVNWTFSPTPPLQGVLWFGNVGELRQKVGHPCDRCSWELESWAKISEFLGCLYNFQCNLYLKKSFAHSGPMPKEISLRRKWKRVVLCLDYICLNIYLLEKLGAEITDTFMPKILRWWKGLSFRELNQMCGLTSGCNLHIELHPLLTPWKYM